MEILNVKGLNDAWNSAIDQLTPGERLESALPLLFKVMCEETARQVLEKVKKGELELP